MAVLYAATMLMMGLTFGWGWSYLVAHPDWSPSLPALPCPPGPAGHYWAAWSTSSLSPWRSSAQASFAIDAIVAVYFAASRSRVPGLIVRSAQADDSG